MSVVLLTEPFSGGGSGSGTVTSVDVSGGTTGLTTSGGPVTTAGVITLGGTLSVGSGGTGAVSLTGILKGTGTTPISIATAGTDYQAPITLTTTGTSGAATFVGNALNIPQYSGSGGTVTTVSVVSANGLAGTVANATTTPAITLSTSITGILKGNGTAISAATAGTDYAPATSGTSILYGNGTGGFSNVTIGSGLSFSTGTLSATGGGGGVSSVTATSPVASSGGSTPDISLSAGYGDTLNPYASKTANYVLAAPNGTSGVPTFRAIVAADIPALNYQAPITLTTTGTSGAATFIGNTLNIPQYTGGGGGTPGGSNTQVQFNNSGSFGGSANFIWDGTNVQLGTQGALRFADADSSNYVAFKAPATIGTNVTWTLPSIDGAYAQVLSTNGSGTLSWITQSGGGSGSPNLDGGTPTSNYGGITAIDGGVP
jgi:hypothetical protein